MESPRQQGHDPPAPLHHPARISPSAAPPPTLLPPINMLPQQPQYTAHDYAHPTPPYAQYQPGAMRPAPAQASGGATGPNGLMRYPLPQMPLEVRQSSAGRRESKKDVKKRTKSGCLTCRKRRIKCDEAQPSCRNCAKSKRECLGYDPIFKQQSGPAPIAVRPETLSPQDVKVAMPSNPYQLAQSFPATEGNYAEYGASLDPALQSGNSAPAMSHATYPPILPSPRIVHPLAIEDLYALHDIPPQYNKREAPPPISPGMEKEVADFYTFHFAPGLNRVLETDWYTTHGLSHLQANPTLHDFVSQVAERFRDDTNTSTDQLRSLEAQLVWELAALPRPTTSTSDLHARLYTLETLLTGDFLDPTRIPSAPHPETPQPRYNEQAFWHQLGRFVSARDDRPDPAAHKQVNDSLAAMRGILGMLENRDVLYSIAVARHIGGQMPDFHPHRPLKAFNDDAEEDRNKLIVAHRFVESESQRGTTQVIQRVCGMALRSWALQRP